MVWGVVLVILIGMWKVFAKAGQPGWACMVPVYNGIVLLEIAKRPLWWLILFIIPFVNFVAALVVSLDVARNFGKSAAFGLGLAFLPFIGVRASHGLCHRTRRLRGGFDSVSNLNGPCWKASVCQVAGK